MFFRDFGKFDKILVGIASLILSISIFFIVEDDWLFDITASELAYLEKIGSVKLSVRDVRRRTKTAFSWLPLKEKKDVYQDDSIYTGEASEAIIVTERGEEIRISQNSLVVISSAADSIFLDIDYGSIQGKVAKDKKLLIGSKDGITEFSGDDALVKIDINKQQKLMVNVLQGQVQLKSKDGLKTLGLNEAAEIGKKGELIKPTDEKIHLLSPMADRVITDDELSSMTFAWKTEFPFSKYKFEVSTDENFKDIINLQETDKTYAKPAQLPKDKRLYWRVVGKQGELDKVKSSAIRFTLVSNTPPELVFPTPNALFKYEPSEEGQDVGVAITAKWQPITPAQLWEVQLSTNSTFSKDVQSLTAKENHILIPSLKSGHYFWRVRPKDFKNAKWSVAADFQIRLKLSGKIQAPQISKAPVDFLIETRFTKKSSDAIKNLSPVALSKLIKRYPKLEWFPVLSSRYYELEISRTSDFLKPLVKAKLNKSQFVWKTVRPGEFYWRVRAVTEQGEKSFYSERRAISVLVKEPTSTAKTEVSEQVTELAMMEASPPPFELSWTPIVYANSYELEFDSKNTFANSLQIKANKNYKKIQAQGPGNYFWRVRGISSDGLPVSKFTQPIPISFVRTYINTEELKQLQLVYPTGDATVVLVGQGQNGVRFRWNSPFKNVKYRIQTSHSPDFDKIALEKTSDSTFFLFGDNLPDGLVYWRIRAEGKIFVSPWTVPSRFQVKHEGKGYQFKDDSVIAVGNAFDEQSEVVAPPPTKKVPVITAITPTVPTQKLEQPGDVQTDTPFILSYKTQFANNKNIVTSTIDRYPLFTWAAVDNAQSYQLEISRSPKFETQVVNQNLASTRFIWNTVTPGQYFVRIQAISNKMLPSPYSRPLTIDIKSQPPSSLNSDVAVDEYPADPNNQTIPNDVVLKWTPSPSAKAYEVQLSKDLSFKESKSLQSLNTWQKIKLSRFGKYFWRIRALDELNRPISDYSKIRSLEVLQADRMPASTSLITGLFPSPNKVLTFVGQGSMNMLFRWTTTSPGPYRLEVSHTPNFSSRLVQIDTKGQELIVQNDLPTGKLYWRVGEIHKGQVRTWSKTIAFEHKKDTPPSEIESSTETREPRAPTDTSTATEEADESEDTE